MRIRSAGEIMNYLDFYSMQSDSLHACVPISVLNSFSTKMLVRQVGHVTIDIGGKFFFFLIFKTSQHLGKVVKDRLVINLSIGH